MLNCEFCSTGRTGTVFTRCCKGLICGDCCDRLDKKLLCMCGRPLAQGRKNYSEYSEIMTILKQFSEQKGKQCDRCSNIAEVDCIDCEMLFCQPCNNQVHTGYGFSKHTRKKIVESKGNVERMRRKEATCISHKESITFGCECGMGLCQLCVKQHKEVCPKNGKQRPLKEFRDEYFLNMLLKMRQISFFKERLADDLDKYAEHFQTQEVNFKECSSLIMEQFDYLRKMLETKEAEVNTKLSLYWSNCQNVYKATCQKIEEQIKKYDQYGELIQKFTQRLVNLDYFDKKIRRFNVNFEFTNIKNINIEQAQNAIMGIGIAQKQWEPIGADFLPPEHSDNRPLAKDDAHILSTLQNTSQLMVDYTQNPLKDRQLNLFSSHSEIHYSFIHLPYQNVKYDIEYGVGMKMKGQQIFKRIQNHNGFGCIEGLNSNTTYRIRMRVNEGAWGSIEQITTLDIPKFNIETSSCAKHMSDNMVQLGKGGLIYGSNEIHFGIHKWVFKLTSKAISYEDTQTACMSVGVSNKETKKATFVGTTFNYGYQKSQTVLKIILDCNEKKMVIINSSTNKQQIYQNLPNFPLFPTLLNKGNSQMLVRYNLTSDDPNSC